MLTLHTDDDFVGCHLSRFTLTTHCSRLFGSLGKWYILQPFLEIFVHFGTQHPGILKKRRPGGRTACLLKRNAYCHSMLPLLPPRVAGARMAAGAKVSLARRH